MHLTSPAFQPGAAIPALYSCDGQNLSPALQWNHGPYGTRSFALVLRDPDAPRGTFIHWILYNLPASARSLPQGLATNAEFPDGSRQGVNNARRIGYTGPCPPPGPVHRYFFTLYALDTLIEIPQPVTKPALARAMQGHILATGELMGRFRH